MDQKEKQLNNRLYDRQASFIIVEYSVIEGKFRDIMKSVSAGGMFINTQRSVAENQAIELKFPLFNFDQVIHIHGRVIRKEANGFAVLFDNPLSDLLCADKELPPIVHEIDR